VSKFVGKFRKNGNYDDDYGSKKSRHRDGNNESKKMLQRMADDDFYYRDNLNHSDSKRNRKEYR
jgi:hypothetical protein